jgi:hypothetical protein
MKSGESREPPKAPQIIDGAVKQLTELWAGIRHLAVLLDARRTP